MECWCICLYILVYTLNRRWYTLLVCAWHGCCSSTISLLHWGGSSWCWLGGLLVCTSPALFQVLFASKECKRAKEQHLQSWSRYIHVYTCIYVYILDLRVYPGWSVSWGNWTKVASSQARKSCAWSWDSSEAQGATKMMQNEQEVWWWTWTVHILCTY